MLGTSIGDTRLRDHRKRRAGLPPFSRVSQLRVTTEAMYTLSTCFYTRLEAASTLKMLRWRHPFSRGAGGDRL